VNRSAKKRDRQSQVRRLRNKEAKSQIRTEVKKFNLACEQANKEQASELLKSSAKLIDSAKGHGVLHASTADRKKSRMSARFNKLA